MAKTASPSLEHRLTKAPDVVENVYADGVALLNMQTGICCELDAVGTELWRALEQRISLAAAAEFLTRLFDVTKERAEADALLLARDLLDLGMLVPLSEVAHA